MLYLSDCQKLSYGLQGRSKGGTALAAALADDEAGLDVEGQGFDRAGEARADFVLW